MAALRALVLACAMLTLARAVDRSKFRTCSHTGFCKRHRQALSSAALPPSGTFSELKLLHHSVEGVLRLGGEPSLLLRILFYESGVRVRVTETSVENAARWESPDVLTPSTMALATFSVEASDARGVTVACAVSGERVKVQFEPLRIDVESSNGVQLVSLNARGLLHFEQRKTAPAAPAEDDFASATADEGAADGREILDWGEDGKPIYADNGGDAAAAKEESSAVLVATPAPTDDRDAPESFGGHTDTKPNGGNSVGLGVAFPGSRHVYGIPEHATGMALKDTDGGGDGAYSEPYRLYNLDVFEYELDEPMALYGAIPLIISHTESTTVGVYWNNPSETFIDVTTSAEGKFTHWMSESGVVDVFLLLGPSPGQVFAQYSRFTGTTTLPPLFAIAYHQCRWNYRDERDVFEVDAKFEEHDFPYDVLWLDIEHTDGKRYFTWDKDKFPNPEEMQRKLASRGRKMVTIVDPHIKRDNGYDVHKTATADGHYVKDALGKDFDGWCWPGSSSYVDFTSASVRSWWADRFGFGQYKGSTGSLYTWNDMNEPSVFNGPEVSMQKDILSTEGVEHREWHNLYGFYQQMATAEGQVRRHADRSERPFVLSRAFFAGSQRHGAIWTGDNAAQWSHLQIATPMLLTQNIAGLPFSGADVGGFFGNPDTELMVRWYQAGSLQPFFRAHAHIDTKRREPWLFGDDVLVQLRDTVRARYALLPLWYTLFEESSRTGMPIMRPLWVQYPKDALTFAVDDAWLVGSDLLVKPVTSAAASELSVYFPGGAQESWYDVVTHAEVGGGQTLTVAAPLDKIPVYQRGGSIVPKKLRVRRCSSMMAADPYTLVVALDQAGSASGELYLDDEHTHSYQSGEYARRSFVYADTVLRASSVEGSGAYRPPNAIERVMVVGLNTAPSAVEVNSEGKTSSAGFAYDEATRTLTIRKPGVLAVADFTIALMG